MGEHGIVLKTTDGGNTWEIKESNVTTDLYSIHFSSVENGWISGNDGIILATTDGGETWVEQMSATRMPLYSICFANDNTGWAGGAFGAIVKTTNGGVTQAEEPVEIKLPQTYSLYQNYPNPFNPSTTISYRLAGTSFVTIKVYDILGKEVASLVNEVKSAGKYTVKFSGDRFSSGVYFYQLRAGSTIQSKKMILMK